MDAGFGLIQGLSTGGVGAAIIAVAFILYKCFQKKRIKSHSGCIDFEISEGGSSPRRESETAVAPPRTPCPSVDKNHKPDK